MFTQLFHVLLSNLSQFKTSKVEPARLSKKVEKSTFEQFCDKICPYVLLFALATICILLLVILVKYGHSITGTEANGYYYHLTD